MCSFVAHLIVKRHLGLTVLKVVEWPSLDAKQLSFYRRLIQIDTLIPATIDTLISATIDEPFLPRSTVLSRLLLSRVLVTCDDGELAPVLVPLNEPKNQAGAVAQPHPLAPSAYRLPPIA